MGLAVRYAIEPLEGRLYLSINTTSGPALSTVLNGTFDGGNLDGSGSAALFVPAGTSISASRVRMGSLEVNGTLTINPGLGANDVPDCSVVNSISIGPNGKLDLGNSSLIINTPDDTTRDSTFITLRNALATGDSAGQWNGLGIDSSVANLNPGRHTGLAIYINGQQPAPNVSIFDGQAVNSDSIILSYVLNGDANVDGAVSGGDFGIIAANFGKPVTAGWTQADFNYDGVVSGTDFGQLAQNFGMSGPYQVDTNDSNAAPRYLATFTDDSPANSLADYTENISWGDGTQTPGAIISDGDGIYHVVGSHPFAQTGTLSISTTITNTDSGDTAPAPTSMTVISPTLFGAALPKPSLVSAYSRKTAHNGTNWDMRALSQPFQCSAHVW